MERRRQRMSHQGCGSLRRECFCTVREATCARGPVSYQLHSSTSLSLTVWGWLATQWQHLALCFPFVKIWLHWITITTSTSCPLLNPPPQPSPRLLLLIPYPQSDPSSWILSICLIISPHHCGPHKVAHSPHRAELRSQRHFNRTSWLLT